MKNKRKYAPLLLALLLLSGAVHAQFLQQVVNQFPIQINQNLRLLPAPSLSYGPETSWSTGGTLIATYHPSTSDDIPVSSAQLDLRYTLNRQFILDIDYHWRGESTHWIFIGSNSYYDYPDRYFSQINPEVSEGIRYKKIECNNQLFRRIQKEVSVGFLHRLQWIGSVDPAPGGIFLSEQPVGFEGGVAHGFGGGGLIDQRKNPLQPSQGYFANLNLTIFSSYWGSDFNFIRMETDVRQYHQLSNQWLIACQGVAMIHLGSPPFRLTGQLGGSQILRGYHANQLTGEQILSFQTELRIPLYARWGMVLFGGAGKNCQEISQLVTSKLHGAVGTGIRFTLDRINQANLRFDVAMGENGLNYYFSYGEAF